ncbi:Crp/Fnr family transcriptional regulator [Lichenihabitans sp. Uapishka_5]|uniref:Crp/Fnr family transcriptional regulator n=1 Tax=Lichenihabitans sp. Uapishka_5 TaxID=3037302 RepID=UPI0029E7F75B|nr:Crp/Fnr family transcriptional regulator [Lichenihabitans sp. Uapishka_5]MDX7952168.1 Crp/Fnr family transcriptional regulator [Lichenihabitans sp. Uapishka_5]
MTNRFIQKLRGFVELTSTEIEALEVATRAPGTFGARKDLIREGDQPGPVFVMLEGWAFRYKVLPSGSRQVMAFLMPGDACDLHISLLAEMDHSIQTVTEAQVAKISRQTMDEMMDTYPGIARAMYIAQLVDEGTLRAWIVSLGRRNSAERAAHLMLELYARAVRAGVASHDEMELPLSQAVLADALGMTPVHVNRTLQELRRSGAIELRRGVLRIQNPTALTKFAGFDENYLHRRLRKPG